LLVGIIDRLTEKGWQVSGSDCKRPFRLVTFYKGNICDRVTLLQALAEVQPSAGYHLVWLLKSERPRWSYAVHVLGIATLLDAILEIGLRPTLLVASYSTVYGSG